MFTIPRTATGLSVFYGRTPISNDQLWDERFDYDVT
jgi:hypothetical protein